MGMEQIEHIVLVMMENRSFDHYLGALNLPPEGRTDVEGLGRGALPINRHLGDPISDPGVQPWPLDDVQLTFLDPPHEFPEVRPQWNLGAMDGFVLVYEAFRAGGRSQREPIAGDRGPGATVPTRRSHRWPSSSLPTASPTTIRLTFPGEGSSSSASW